MNEQILNILKTMPANELNNILNRELLRGLCFSRFGINTIYDLYEFNDFNNLTPAKKYKFERLHNILHNENDASLQDILDYYNQNYVINTIPSYISESDSFAQMMMKFLKEFCEFQSDTQRAKAVELVYIHGFDFDTARQELNFITSERIRQLTSATSTNYPDSFIQMLNRLVNDDEQTIKKERFQIAEPLKHKLLEIINLCNKTIFKNDLLEKCGMDNSNKHLMNFILHFTQTNEYICSDRNRRLSGDFIVKQNNKELKHEYWSFIFNKLNDEIEPYSKTELKDQLNMKYPNISPEIYDTIFEIIECSPQFITIQDGIVTKYQLAWKDLNSVQSKVERILFDSGRCMQRQEIEAEYNRLVTINKLESGDTFIYKSRRKSSVDKNKEINNISEKASGGYWIWDKHNNFTETTSVQYIIKAFLAEQKSAKLEEVIKHVRSIIPNANENSIKTLVNNFCYSTTVDIYVYKDCYREFPEYDFVMQENPLCKIIKMMECNKTYTLDELYELYYKKYEMHITSIKINRTIENAGELFIIQKGSRSIPRRIQITKEGKAYSPEKDDITEKQYNKEYKNRIRQEAINILRYTQGHKCPLSSLVQTTRKYVPSNLKPNAIYKIFNDDPIFIKESNNTEKTIALDFDVWSKLYSNEIENNTRQEYIPPQETQYQNNNIQDALYFFNPTQHLDLIKEQVSYITTNSRNKLHNEKPIEDFDQAWNNMIEITQILKEGINGGYRRLFGLLFNYLFGKTTIYERYSLCTELTLGFEDFIKKLLSRLFPHEMLEDGLTTNIKRLQDKELLPSRYHTCYLNTCITRIIRTRNNQAHNVHNTPDDSIIINKINEYLTVYLYIATLL